jgi:hypothetical protein
MTAHKRKATTRAATKSLPATPDAELIRACVRYAQAIAAADAAFTADPDGDSAYAEPAADKYYRGANKSLAVISSIAATTASGVCAKANIVKLLLRDNNLEPKCAAFFATFAADVKAQSEALLKADRAAANKIVN